jgi:hypothetical protein
VPAGLPRSTTPGDVSFGHPCLGEPGRGRPKGAGGHRVASRRVQGPACGRSSASSSSAVTLGGKRRPYRDRRTRIDCPNLAPLQRCLRQLDLPAIPFSRSFTRIVQVPPLQRRRLWGSRPHPQRPISLSFRTRHPPSASRRMPLTLGGHVSSGLSYPKGCYDWSAYDAP